jgi:ribonuclease Z
MPASPPILEVLGASRSPRARELVILGTAAQVPTRERNHNGYVLRWNGDAILFDPGEGTQRQLLQAGISSSSIGAICITHFHGDHCLGLPGVLARFALDHREEPVDIYYPAGGALQLERLRRVASVDPWPNVRLHPLPPRRSVLPLGNGSLVAEPLCHTTDTLGWRVEEAERRHVLTTRTDALGVDRRQLGRLLRQGWLDRGGDRVWLAEVSEQRPGQVFAFLMDTALCDAAVSLAEGADLVVCESTFLDDELDLATEKRHLTARQAAWIASEAGARSLALTHFSQRHADEAVYERDAAEVFPNVVAVHDLTVLAVPARG